MNVSVTGLRKKAGFANCSRIGPREVVSNFWEMPEDTDRKILSMIFTTMLNVA